MDAVLNSDLPLKNKNDDQSKSTTNSSSKRYYSNSTIVWDDFDQCVDNTIEQSTNENNAFIYDQVNFKFNESTANHSQTVNLIGNIFSFQQME